MTEYVDRRSRMINAPIGDAFRVLGMIGGEIGWFSPRWLWRLRGWLDRMGGGPGLVPRRDPVRLQIGDLVDFWRVTAIEPPHRLRMLTELRMPGVGILEFELTPIDDVTCRLSQTARFSPTNVFGHLYWLLLTPLHHYIFRQMINGIARRAESPGAVAGTR